MLSVDVAAGPVVVVVVFLVVVVVVVVVEVLSHSDIADSKSASIESATEEITAASVLSAYAIKGVPALISLDSVVVVVVASA